MNKISIVLVFAMLAGFAGAGVIYSNDFSGTEFRATGVSNGVFGLTVESGGRLTPTSNTTAGTVGFRVDLNSLALITDPNVTAVKMTISGKAPLTADLGGWVGLAFLDVANYNLNAGANPGIYISGSGNFRATGGLGFANAFVALAQGTNFTSGAEFTMALQYNKNGTIDAWYNNVQVYTSQAITPTDPVELKHAVIGFRGTDITGANIDTFTVEVIPEPTTLGLFTISSAAVLFLRRIVSAN